MAIPQKQQLFWFLPTQGDGRYLGTSKGGRAVTLAYLQQLAIAVDNIGFHGVLVPTGKACEDPWVTAAALVSVTQKLRFLVAVRPGLQPPSLAARMAATLDRLSGGRVLINVVTSGDPIENKGDGLFFDHQERYHMTKEFLEVYKPLMNGQQVNYQGDYIQVENAHLLYPPLQPSGPALYLGGSSAEAMEIAAEYVDTYLTWGEPLAEVAEKINQVKQHAADKGHCLEFGIRLHVIVRETEQEAIDEANKLIAHLDDDTIAQAQATFARMDSKGQARMQALHKGSRENLFIAPNLWAGIGLVRVGAGTALVGDPQQIVSRIKEYQAIGITKFILSGYPHLEEAHRFAELVMPLLETSTEILAATSTLNEQSKGEAIGAHSRPK
ncbi:FMNH2-dependent alkanesulfonate monooxygenase [Providencia vermicola]|uniref:alkanesulfonate monooxygenase n=2 Tax=Providencia stuartii TaxID=588 RepID=A0AAI9HWE4_PROST|nr:MULTISPECIES: FMNH2-dependent alkanesulfonate monooxygenase [Providencia]ELR5045783.1 FMNH2-dependent alkanesulfonate monooxygenase [Providencia rettgeri]ELR5033959.1 FMNH2-dependent alkanesulfonate monooxygenase [Providencia stuartii]ELR5119675.1 FMNH2-dependent alkanesulfonate monooxygenase [Providencia stuartii]ELR5141419.1 FMNH2-dependent alkanesulfonate monooxygenase [Providencia stuartii]ELR5290777.1 FMNH2-dependent alkanesulfonate monooxygenase [Providencia stuartii]